MIDFSKMNGEMALPSGKSADEAKTHWNSIAKPIGSLGLLEDAIVRIAALTESSIVALDKRAVLVFCADNGVVEEGVTQTGQEVTAIVAENMAIGNSSVCRMAQTVNAKVIPINVGMANNAKGVLNRSISKGTANFTRGPAMTPEQTEKAIQVGINCVRELSKEGYRVFAVGEMGIGNTTTASALVSVLLRIPVEKVTGRGAGLSDEGLKRKIDAINRGIKVNRPDAKNAFDVLCKLGGYDIAGMVGAFLGAAMYHIPIIIDGFISAVAALLAARLCPNSISAMFASHMSAEPAAKEVFRVLGLKPIINGNMRLGEGTGAVCLLPLLDMALAVYNDTASFEDIGIEQYKEPTV